MKRNIYCCYASIESYQRLRYYLFSFQSSYNFFFEYLHFYNISPSLTLSSLHYFSNFYPPPYLFISPLPFTLISFFIFLFIFLYFSLFLFTLSYYKFVTTCSILCIVFLTKKKVLSLSIFWWIFFFNKFFLHLCFELIIFYIL